MASFNKVTILGNLGRDPEVRTTPAGNTVANFSVATTDKWGQGEERQERTEWHRVVVWGKLAETCGEYLSKGRQVLVEGRLQSHSYDDNEGVKRYVTEIIAHQVEFLEPAEWRERPAQRGAPERRRRCAVLSWAAAPRGGAWLRSSGRGRE